jgi:tetratricopeptide (TPR) repeat protein
MPSKMDAKELKEPDKLQVTFYKVMQIVNENRKLVYVGSAVICIILLLAGGYYLYLLDYEKKATQLYTKVFNEKMKAAASSDKNFNPIDVYSQISMKYPDSHAAQLVQYRMGNYLYERGEIDKAIQAYIAFLSRSSRDNDIKTLAHAGLGYCYEAKKDYKNALVSFQKALATKEGKYFASMTYTNIARVYEQMNERIKAVEYYKKALTDTTDPSAQMLLKRKIAALS